MTSSWMRRLGSLAGLGFLLFASTCSSASVDGEACETGDDCKSNRCLDGACVDSRCDCEGADCRGRSTCEEGWLCVRPVSGREDPAPSCRKQCAGRGTCSPSRHCEEGVCRDGPEIFAIEWVSLPRKSPCAPRVPCPYEVRPPAGVTIAKYDWRATPQGSGKPPPNQTSTEPKALLTYPDPGTYLVTVTATAADGAVATQSGTEVLCVPQGGLCDPTGALCCGTATCSIKNECQ